MGMTQEFGLADLSRAEIDELVGPTVLEFGTSWCPICMSGQPLIGTAIRGHLDVRHIKIEDGPGRALGRSFHVKLWPTLIFLRDGTEVARVVRPSDARKISEAMALLDMQVS
jgi:Thioredoxin.